MQIQVDRQIDAENMETFRFNVFETTAVFVDWSKLTKPKGKRTWRVVQAWDKYGRQDINRTQEPVLPEAVKAEAMKQMIDRISVKTWDEWKGDK